MLHFIAKKKQLLKDILYMKILSIELKDFKRFSLSGIRCIKADINEFIQILIGTNGSGKSSLLNELTPYAAVKPMYGKKGYKQLKIEHNGSYYTLISDFGNKSKTHSFIKDDVELNIGGTSTIQNELVATHFNYTSVIHDLLYNNYHMCQMSKADRKTLLIQLNPIDMSVVLEKHKFVCSKLREYKSNLSMLYRRKQEIEANLKSDDWFKEKYKLRDLLNIQYTEYSNTEYHLQQVYTKIKEQLHNEFKQITPSVSKEKIKELDHNTIQFMDAHRYLPEVDSVESYNQCSISLGSTYELITQLESQISELLQEITLYETNVQAMDINSSINIIEEKCKEYTRVLRTLPDEKEYIFIPEDQLSRYELIKDFIINEMGYFNDLHMAHFVVFTDVLSKIKNHLDYLEKSKLVEIHNRRSFLQHQIQEIDIALAKLPKDPTTILDQCNICDFRRIYAEQAVTLTNKKHTLTQEFTITDNRYTRYRAACDAIRVYYTEQHEAHARIMRIWDKLRGTCFFEDINSLVSKINIDSQLFIKKIVDNITIMPLIYKRKSIDTELFQLQQQLEIMAKTNTPSLKFLQELIVSKKQQLSNLQSLISIKYDYIEELKKQQNIYQTYLQYSKEVAQIKKELESYEKYILLSKTIEFYTIELSKLKTQKDQVALQTRDTDIEIKEQETLTSRYKEEVLTLIDRIEQDKLIYEEIEWSISPSTGFPHKSMIDYINILISNVNCILDSICTYQLEIVPLTMNDALDYSFKVLVDGNNIDDISKLSKGQRSIVDLAWSLSFIIGLGLTDYPLFLDEIMDGLDPTHTQHVLEWIRDIADQRYASQLWLVNHDAVVSGGFSDCGVICLMDTNVSPPTNANKYVTIT